MAKSNNRKRQSKNRRRRLKGGSAASDRVSGFVSKSCGASEQISSPKVAGDVSALNLYSIQAGGSPASSLVMSSGPEFDYPKAFGGAFQAQCGGKRRSRKGKKSKSKKSKRSRKLRSARGGGSDWGHTLYSRTLDDSKAGANFPHFSSQANAVPKADLMKPQFPQGANSGVLPAGAPLACAQVGAGKRRRRKSRKSRKSRSKK